MLPKHKGFLPSIKNSEKAPLPFALLAEWAGWLAGWLGWLAGLAGWPLSPIRKAPLPFARFCRYLRYLSHVTFTTLQ